MSEPKTPGKRRKISIVTKGGDGGQTALLYGQRVAKNHPQIEACGWFDELNASLGLAKAHSTSPGRRAQLEALQHDLVALMGEVVCAQSDEARYLASPFRKLEAASLERIEAAIAEMEARDLRFDGWATPGANLEAAALDVARTVARRAERGLSALEAHGRSVRPLVRQFVNRASDLLWMLARDAETGPA